MLKLGLTGGIASGKSVVGEMFVKLGAHLIQSDAIAHWLMDPGRPVYGKVIATFGASILNPDRTINRAKLAEAAFGPSHRVQELNAIVHPAVIAHENEWMRDIGERDPNAIAIVEAALILEAGAAARFDYLILVTCREEQRVERLAKRLGLTDEAARAEVSRRMAAQWPDEKKAKAADFIIDNSGPLDATARQVRQLYSKLIAPQNRGR